ncbi:MAG TPA: hypothetical protein PKL75_02565, partial [Treponemataceae bacterium]|nr:hypothetical protein [Treponemataceae bacterium]
MNQRTLEVLEYPRIREEIAGLCMSAEGKSALLAREPSVDPGEIALLKRLASAWLQALSAETPPALVGWPSVGPYLPRLRVEGASLSVEELHAVGLFCDAVGKFRAWADVRARQAASGKRDLMAGSAPAASPYSAQPLEERSDGSVPAVPDEIARTVYDSAAAYSTADGPVIASALAV